MTLHPYKGISPTIDPAAYVAPSADVVGDVTLGAESSLWFGAVARGDVNPLRIGARTSIQDNAVMHATGGWTETHIGDDCTVGHGVILHGCTVGDRVLVGMGSILLDAATVGSDCIIGAGSLVTMRTEIPSGVLAFGRPAKVIRELTDEERAQIRESAGHYVQLVRDYRGG
ncbi:MAG TPA: gamma carbonic anhydrase family protein [Sandaracinaceae bacterium LLY-WYZ-13_1]|nr:gamma carbonic anhydrase family protein [Sandaracinaceae bacterium LLY-WYZ-13_1]